MEYAQGGPLMQMIVIQALCDYVAKIQGNRAAFLDAMKKNPMISGEAWLACVEELERELEAKYPSGKKKA